MSDNPRQNVDSDINDGASSRAVQTVTFSVGPPASSGGVDDSALMDDNDLTTGLLNGTISNNDRGDGNDDDPEDTSRLGLTASQLALAATRRHSSVRLVMRKIGNFVASFTLLAMLLLVPIIIYRALTKRKLDIAAWHSAGVMMGGTVILSIRLVYLHFTHWYMPGVQKYVVRILFMVPIYAVQSWLSLRFHHARIYIDTIRDLYEAFVIASFVYYLIELLGGEESMVRILHYKVREDPSMERHLGHHAFPLSLVLTPWKLGVEFMLQCKHGVLQYVVAKTIATVLTYFCQSLGVYGEGQFSWKVAYPYIAFFMNISVMYALYCLVKLFHAVNDELRHPIDWHPLGKFLCIKGVVFFTWWQGVLIFYLKAHGIIDDIGSWTGEDVANGLIDYCICIEMVGFAVAHSFTFSYKEYLPSTVEEAIATYAQVQQEQESNNDEDGGDGNGEGRRRGPAYHPPETLSRPMKFKDAFWSSTVPKETLHDIRRLQNGVDRAAAQISDPGTISLQKMPAFNESSWSENPPQPQNVV
ncbi:organic solute transporter Ost alpha [Nitzschia inconspicua]|uniref:Organic solute transporter Ost alpha n=1 Tax=Nitzschia inconspicua TaxID=303405 RepID=A0A9K3LPB7_9STRA|nr:organic solute transporter Ost alpha [Nitzschia inconspicua]